MLQMFHRLASPKYFYRYSGYIIPWVGICCALTFAYGLVGGLFLAPADYEQGEGYRMIYLHVPSAFMSLCVYVAMALFALLDFVWKIKLADIAAKICASLGAWFTFIALFTGAVWGKPMWGTWWIWDARLTSELILLFLYLGVMALRSAIPDARNASKACALLTFVGLVNIPIIHYSVYWWNTLHQGSTLMTFSKPLIAPSMLYPLLAMITAFMLYFITVLLISVRFEVWKNDSSLS